MCPRLERKTLGVLRQENNATFVIFYADKTVLLSDTTKVSHIYMLLFSFIYDAPNQFSFKLTRSYIKELQAETK